MLINTATKLIFFIHKKKGEKICIRKNKIDEAMTDISQSLDQEVFTEFKKS